MPFTQHPAISVLIQNCVIVIALSLIAWFTSNPVVLVLAYILVQPLPQLVYEHNNSEGFPGDFDGKSQDDGYGENKAGFTSSLGKKL